MIDLTKIDLANKEVFRSIKEESEDVLISDDSQRAYVFIYNLPIVLLQKQNQNLETNNPKLATAYQELSDKLSIVAIPSLSRDEIVQLFKDKLLLALREMKDGLVEKLRAALMGIPAFSSRDELRKKLRQALVENKERISTMNIDLNGRAVSPTIGNWIKKYEQELGVRPVGGLELNKFLANGQNMKNLDKSDKEVIRRLFGLYEFLKLSSQTPEGLEEPVIFDIDGKLKQLNGGEFEDVKLEAKVKAILDGVFKKYKELNPEYGSTEEGKTAVEEPYPSPDVDLDITKAISFSRAILDETKGNKEVLFKKLDKAINVGGRDQGLAIMLLLAQLRIFDDLLVDERFAALVREDLKKAGADDKVRELKLNPTSSQFVARLLKIVLQEKLGLGQGEALAFGQKLSQILAMEGEKYTKIVSQKQDGGWGWNL